MWYLIIQKQYGLEEYRVSHRSTLIKQAWGELSVTKPGDSAVPLDYEATAPRAFAYPTESPGPRL